MHDLQRLKVYRMIVHAVKYCDYVKHAAEAALLSKHAEGIKLGVRTLLHWHGTMEHESSRVHVAEIFIVPMHKGRLVEE